MGAVEVRASRLCFRWPSRAKPLRAASILVAAVCAGAALAWKPTTHVYLSEVALRDALDDGKVTILRVDYERGRILKEIGDYEVPADLLAALRACREQFRAGVLGPDAFPDIATGQSAIHPGDDPRVGGLEGNEPGEGSDAWLGYLWRESAGQSGAIRAWIAGFFTHAAGDLYAHTFVNHFAGGEFEAGPNALRHVVLEGYLGRRCPPVADYSVSLDGAREFLAAKLCKMPPGSELWKLLVGPGAENSPIRFFGDLRRSLAAEQSSYDALSRAERLRYDVAHPGRRAYVSAWIRDIDDGLDAWPEFSMRLAAHLTFNPGDVDPQKAEAEAKAFASNHLLSMLGFPDFAGRTLPLFEAIAAKPLTKQQRETLQQMKQGFLNRLFTKAFGHSLDDLSKKIKNPERYFDEALGPSSAGGSPANSVSLATMNREVLGLADLGYDDPAERWDWRTFPPAYNTVTLVKLSFLAPETVNRLLDDLDSALQPRGPRLAAGANVLLDFQNSLDDDNQWHANVGKSIFVRTGHYRSLFMKQIGEK